VFFTVFISDAAPIQSLDESSATLGTPQELKQSRDEPHGRICAFSSDTDAVIELLCKEINASSGKFQYRFEPGCSEGISDQH
jgi:hypothetical protein